MLSEQQIEEMMSRVRRLELRARRLVRETFSGEYQSSFRGQGLDFDDFREYQHGDEVRFIDWNVTARMNQPYVRKFREARELSVMLAVDVSGSADFGSVMWSKRETAAEAAAVLGFSALQNGNKVGLVLFAHEVVLTIPPEKGTRHLLRLIREILAATPPPRGTSVASACDFLCRSQRRRSLVFLISDFFADPLDGPLGKLARQHETVALQVEDPIERELPNAGRVVMMDAESGQHAVVNTDNPNLRMGYETLMRRHREGLRKLFIKHGIDHAKLQSHGDVLAQLHQLMKRRSRLKLR